MNLENHPCFNKHARMKHGRIHLPVAPRCNVQCNFCSRKYDCVNESRPGVTSGVLSPGMAMDYLNQVIQQRDDISVVGIAGPGDPFANPDETIETLSLVREAYPDMLLCVATNGLTLPAYIPEMVALNLSHITVTVNAIDPVIGARIYSWVRSGKHVFHGEEAAQILLNNQLSAIASMKAHGMIVKVNTVIIGGVNDTHIEDIAKRMSELKVDIHNCIPFYAVEGSAFADLPEPDADMVKRVRQASGRHLPQMLHCTRCRADAIGLLNETTIPDFKQVQGDGIFISTAHSKKSARSQVTVSPSPSRPFLAVTSREGMLVNQHLGEAEEIYIYENTPDGPNLVSIRPTPARGSGNQRWIQLAGLIKDCHTLLVNGIGPNPRQVLVESGVDVFEVEGLITEILGTLQSGKSISHLTKSDAFTCGSGCSGNGGGCG